MLFFNENNDIILSYGHLKVNEKERGREMKKEILLFDLDGTLFDTKPGIINCFKYALDYYGIITDENFDFNRVIGPPLHKSFQNYFGFDEKKAVEAAAKYRERYKDEGIFECEPYEGMKEALEALKSNGARIGVATSKPEIFAERIIEKFGFSPYFDFVTGSMLDNSRSTKSEVITEALRLFGALQDRDKVIMIGDREHDIIGAKETGLESMGVEYGFAKEGELNKAGADYIAKDVEEMKKQLLTMLL